MTYMFFTPRSFTKKDRKKKLAVNQTNSSKRHITKQQGNKNDSLLK